MRSNIQRALALLKGEKVSDALGCLSFESIDPLEKYQALCLKAYCYMKQDKRDMLNKCLIAIDKSKEQHSALSTEILGDLFREQGDLQKALKAYYLSLTHDAYDYRMMEKTREVANLAQTNLMIDYFPVAALENNVAESKNSDKVMLLSEVNVIGQACLLFNRDWEYLLTEQDIAHADRFDTVAVTQIRNILGFIAATSVGAKPRVLASIPHHGKSLERAIVLSHRATDNYFHWLLEVIPRWQVLESQPQFESWPVLVNARMPSQHYEILSLLIGEQRQVVRAEINQRLELKQAVLLADVQHIAFEPRPGQQLREDDVQYSEEAIEYLRRCFLPSELPLVDRRIYLSRKSSMLKKRQILNAEAVEASFSAMGFEVVDTAELSFQQQVELFASASIIAGASGASFSNMVFAQSVAKVLMIISPLHNMGLYFRNLAAACGIDDYQEFEAIHVVDTDTFHSDYRVDIEALTQTLEGMLA